MFKGATLLRIPRQFVDEMIAHAQEENPNECCGLLASSGEQVMKHYRITNTEKSPFRYRMDPRDLLSATREIEDNGWLLRVIYHSHTHSEAYPSQTDVRLAIWQDTEQAIWPETYYILISLMNESAPDVRAFQVQDGGAITEEELLII